MSLLLALMFAQAGAAMAETDCENAITQQDMNWCAAQDFHEADAALNAQWRISAAEMHRRDTEAAESGLSEDGRPGSFDTLLTAQRAWLAYRDSHCASEGLNYWGGSLQPLIVATCRTALTENRTAQLRDLVDERH